MPLLLTLAATACSPKAPPSLPVTPGPATLVEMTTADVAVSEKTALYAALASAPIKPCFEALLAQNPNANGEVVVRFTIGTAGLVEESVAAFATLGDATAESCVANAVRTLQFATRTEPLTVRYPFLLVTDRTPPEVARALKQRYGLLPDQETDPSGDPRLPPPPGVVVVW